MPLPYQPKAPGAPAQWQAKSRRHGRLRHVGGGLLRLRAASGRPAASRRMFQGRPLGPAMAVRRMRRSPQSPADAPKAAEAESAWAGEPLDVSSETPSLSYRLSASGALDRLCKLGMEQHCKWKVYGTDSLGGKGCTRMRPNLKLHLPIFWVRFPSHWCHGIAPHLEGCAVSHRSIRG